jgi:diguanylate cyclase (GGDEF)-like protein/PAS domain S-box-containing protein
MMGPEYSAVCFHSAVEALAWLETETADLLVVDFRMPEMDGAEFISRVRARSSGVQIPAIMITARQDRECRITALDAGATDFLQSPVSDTEFRERVLLLIGQHKKNIELSRHSEGRRNTLEPTDKAESANSRSMLEQIIDTSPILLNATDRDGKILFLNSYQSALLGAEPEKLVGRSLSEILPPDLAQRETDRNSQILENGGNISSFEERYVTDGIELSFHCNKAPLTNIDGQTIGVLTTGIDITARKFAEEHRTHLALHDMLTGLPNRTLLSERMATEIATCKAQKSISALLLLDLDRFKIINDTRGHQVGDRLLRQVAERISSNLRPGDFAARIGGDEFAIILSNVAGPEEIISRSEYLLAEIGQNYSIDGVDQVIGGSLGIALVPSDSDNADELLRLADLAMYEAKAQGRDCHRFFSPKLNQIAQLNAQMEHDLRQALEKNQFFLEYQPLVDTRTNKISGLEALLRWHHPEKGRLMPMDFLKVANDSGLIDRIGSQVIELACRQIAELHASGIEIPCIAVNVSPRQFHAMGMSQEILRNISKYRVQSGKLAIEITEELLLDQNLNINTELELLRRHGVGISIDDFGTGYSSLQYLRDLPATKLKIDQTFVARIEHSAADRAIISTIAHLAHALEMSVVAEGVETEAQFALLSASGCDEVQGYFLGRPLPALQLAEIFRSGAADFRQAVSR